MHRRLKVLSPDWLRGGHSHWKMTTIVCMNPFLTAQAGQCRIVSRQDLLNSGMRPKHITSAVPSNTLIRVRRDHYALHGSLRSLIDARVDAGQESVVCDLFRSAGYRCDIQVSIDGVGRVDILVEGCVVVEADSQSHHKTWDEHIRDRTRDRLLAALGYVTLRVLYQDIMFDPEGVLRAMQKLVDICRFGSPRVFTVDQTTGIRGA